jgi:hypothetical protein
MLSIREVTDADGVKAVGLLISAEHVFLDPTTGDPQPGVSLSPGSAREAAFTLLLIAQQVENKLKENTI